ncbi:hypothetical protein JOJ87_004584 [Rhodococcus ruber]|uniref:Uncharacterized protein n=1 Tax=Rhodococcus ruber TaxID=1830 RepID=A0A098BMS3_9NOCA|nr:hypothetical protein [Rhodococcus ruber]CDZ90024.1 hypothetical protein RHRU231_590083 [Rhodococcus ruber]
MASSEVVGDIADVAFSIADVADVAVEEPESSDEHAATPIIAIAPIPTAAKLFRVLITMALFPSVS